ncbi:MAG: hypothetical protein KJP16_00880, partial [Gammaproteobacteria bacterium]|nr:hypothetical protein [Gammaproteobacteria bacterium]NNL49338.1 hypothetical protein [Woeseiaceae bacterium]
GRESFLPPVTWETEPYPWKQEKLTFPVFSPTTGRVELQYPLPLASAAEQVRGDFRDDFDGQAFDLQWNFRRAPMTAFHTLRQQPGSLRMMLQTGRIGERTQYSFVGIRQRHFEFEAVTKMTFTPGGREEAGLVAVQNDRSAFLMTLATGIDGNEVRLIQSFNGDSRHIAAMPIAGDMVFLKIAGDYLMHDFLFSTDGKTWTSLADNVDITALSPAVIDGYNYTGVYLGLYASSNGAESINYADFDYFYYEPTSQSRDAWFERQVANEKDR